MLRSKFVGCLIGNVIGDALGKSLEGLHISEPKIGENFSGCWTDDARAKPITALI